METAKVMFYATPEDKEIRVNGILYSTDFPLDKLYPFNSDPLNFYDTCKKEYTGMSELPINIQVQCIGGQAIDAGFKGMIFKWTDTLRVDIFQKVPVKQVEKIEKKSGTSNNEKLSKETTTETIIGEIIINGAKYYVVIPANMIIDLTNARGMENIKELNKKTYRMQIPEYLFNQIKFKPEYEYLKKTIKKTA